MKHEIKICSIMAPVTCERRSSANFSPVQSCNYTARSHQYHCECDPKVALYRVHSVEQVGDFIILYFNRMTGKIAVHVGPSSTFQAHAHALKVHLQQY